MPWRGFSHFFADRFFNFRLTFCLHALLEGFHNGTRTRDRARLPDQTGIGAIGGTQERYGLSRQGRPLKKLLKPLNPVAAVTLVGNLASCFRFLFAPVHQEIAMKKYLRRAILAATFATPALATDSWYLSYNGKRCEIFAKKHQGGNWNTVAVYPSRQAAEKAKQKTDKCQKD